MVLKSTHTVARSTRGAHVPDGPLSGPSGTFYPGRSQRTGRRSAPGFVWQIVPSDVVQASSLADQVVTSLGMGDRDEVGNAFADASPE
jgi:hypothetical protein